MSSFSKTEYLLKFRKNFPGPIKFKEGDLFWAKIKPMVFKTPEDSELYREFYACKIEPWHPLFNKIEKLYKKHHDDDWNGEFVFPCEYVYLDADLEDELRHDHEISVAAWRTKYDGGVHDEDDRAEQERGSGPDQLSDGDGC